LKQGAVLHQIRNVDHIFFMLRATLFQLRPAWTTFFQDAEHELAQVIAEQCSNEPLTAANALKHADVCWLLSTPQSQPVVPQVSDIDKASYPQLRAIILRVTSYLCPKQTMTHNKYVSFCLEFFRLSDPTKAEARTAKSQRDFFVSILRRLLDRLEQFAYCLDDVLVTQPADEKSDDSRIAQNASREDASREAQIVESLKGKLNAGFFGSPRECAAKYLRMSIVAHSVGNRLHRFYRVWPSLALRESIVRLERFINATQLDLLHRLRLAFDNLHRYFDSACLALHVLVRSNLPEPRWKTNQVPQPVDAELSRDKLIVQDNKRSQTQKEDSELLNILFTYMALRSAYVAEDGSVHQKIWHTNRKEPGFVDTRGPAGAGQDNNVHKLKQDSSPKRRWTHAMLQSYESVEKFLYSLQIKRQVMLRAIQMLMFGKSSSMRDVLKRWPALRCPLRNRNVVAYTNGLLITSTGDFVACNHPQRLLPAGLVAMRYFKGQQFPSTAINLVMGAANRLDQGCAVRLALDDPAEPPLSAKECQETEVKAAALLLPTRHARIVLQTQEFDNAERCTIQALLGRTRYPIRERDNWDVMTIALGVAGTGKSTLLLFLHHLFERDNVGIMGNRIERVFGLYAFFDRMVVFGFDLNDKFPLDQAVLHSMICGEGVTVSRKRLSPLSILWSTHLVWAMNVLPKEYQDSDFSLLRRLVVFKFDKMIAKKYPNLMQDFHKLEAPFFLYQIILFYEQLLLRKPGASFWEICEPKFLATRRSLLGELSLLEGFLRCNKLDRSPVVQIKMDLAGMSEREKAQFSQDELPLLDARYTLVRGNNLVVRFPDNSYLHVSDSEPIIGQEEFWNTFQGYVKEQNKKKQSFTRDMWTGVFHRYGIIEVFHLSHFASGAFAGIKLV
jgi:hypothetical protein